MSIQEHFQSQVTTGRKTTGNASRIFDESFRSFKNFVVPAYRQPGQVRGRAAGGLAQLSNSTKDVKLQRVNSDSRRIQAQIIHFPNFKLLWGNAYFPTDPGAGHFEDAELHTVLQEMETVMEKEDFDHVLWNGDFICDFSRNTTFVGLVRDFLHKIGLLAVWEDSQHFVNYTKYMWIYNLHQYWTILFAMKVFFHFHTSLMSEFYILVIIWTDTLLS